MGTKKDFPLIDWSSLDAWLCRNENNLENLGDTNDKINERIREQTIRSDRPNEQRNAEDNAQTLDFGDAGIL